VGVTSIFASLPFYYTRVDACAITFFVTQASDMVIIEVGILAKGQA